MAAKLNPMPHDITSEGLALPYGKEAGSFRFYAMAIAALLCIGFYLSGGHSVLLALGVSAACVSYYFFPLIEGRARLGASQYGIFVDGLGLIPWREINDLLLRTYAVRTMDNKELHIQLKRNLDTALIMDWRRQPIYRLLMKLPWKLEGDNLVRIRLEPFGNDPDEVFEAISRIWRFYR